MKKGLLSCIMFGALFPLMAQQATLVRQEMVMEKPPVPAAHASTMTELPDGRLMASWFGGTRESAKDVCIYTAVYSKGKWSVPVVVADGVINDTLRYPAWNPVLYTNPKGEILLFYKVGPNPREWWGLMKTSKDKGKTWSKAVPLPDSILGPIRNKPVLLSNGRLLHPSSTESLDERVWAVHMEISDTDGKNWQYIPVDCDTFGVIQPTVLFHPGNKLQMLCRSRQNAIVESWSEDNGLTWSLLRKQDMLNPNSGIDAVTTKRGLHVLIYNPAVSGKDWWLGRNELRVGVSKDGEHWTDVYQLEKEEKGEFSYPAVIAGKNGDIHISYTYDRKNIKHVVLKIK